MSLPAVRCSFYLREPVGDLWRYRPIQVNTPTGSGLPMQHLPLVGDLVFVPGGQVRIVERAWLPPAWGSASWPYDAVEPIEGPMLDLIVEHAVGPFRDEAPEPDDEEPR